MSFCRQLSAIETILQFSGGVTIEQSNHGASVVNSILGKVVTLSGGCLPKNLKNESKNGTL